MRRLSISSSLFTAAALCVANVAWSQSSDGDWTAPRTPWGDPDLQGIYNYATVTPLERPLELGEQAVFDEQEAAALEEEMAHAMDQDRRDGGNEADVARN